MNMMWNLLSLLDLDGHWTGDGMEYSYPAKKVLCTKPGANGDGGRGRPKLRWRGELEEDYAQVGCRNWRTNAQSREKWQKLMEEDKSHPVM